jgi:hypothetical protein
VTNPSSPTLVNLIAVAANDTTYQGVDWSVCSTASTCGTFQVTPGFPATQTALAVPPVYSPTIHAASGQAVSYLPPTSVPTNQNGTVSVNVASTAEPAASATAIIQMENTSNGFTGAAVTGTVVAGNVPNAGELGFPVSGATVQLFAAGSQCYGSAYGSGNCPSANDPLVFPNGTSSATTSSNGSFTIPAGYTCSPNSLLYVVASGGTPQGLGLTSPNVQLGLMTALGPCSNLNSSVPIVLNEVTTIATVYALAPFTGADYAQIGTSSTNYDSPGVLGYNNGLANAFATVNNLVDITTGQALSVTPAGGSFIPPGGTNPVNIGTAPQAEINTLADVIDTCAASAGGAPGDGSRCDFYFQASNTSPPLGAPPLPGNSPTTILQAVLEVAQHPGIAGIDPIDRPSPTAGEPLYDVLSNAVAGNPPLVPPFSPSLFTNGAGAPNDWSIALSFTGGGLEGAVLASPQSKAMAIDGSGNLWIANGRISSVTELSNLGAAISPFGTGADSTIAAAGGFKGGGLKKPEKIAIDPIGDAWVLNNNSSLTELNSSGTAVTGSPFSGAGSNAANGLAIDATGDAWITDSGSPGDVGEYAGYNTVINGQQVPNGTPVSPAGGYAIAAASNPNAANADPNGAIVINSSGDVWVLDGGNYTAVELSTTGQLLDTDCGDQIDSQTNAPYNPPVCLLSVLHFGNSMALDSAGDIFIPDPSQASAELYELLAGGGTTNFGGVGKNDSESIPPTNVPIAIDGSGHIWLMTTASSNGNSAVPAALTEFSASGAGLNFASANSSAAPGFLCPSSVCPNFNNAVSIDVDASGNVWVLTGTSSSTVTEFVGAATPVVTPSSADKPGKKP